MNISNITISLELLLLNDLLSSNTIDQATYELATKKVCSTSTEDTSDNTSHTNI